MAKKSAPADPPSGGEGGNDPPSGQSNLPSGNDQPSGGEGGGNDQTPPPAPPPPPEPGPGEAYYWECPIHGHWGTRDPENQAIVRDGSYYCPDHPGTKLVAVRVPAADG